MEDKLHGAFIVIGFALGVIVGIVTNHWAWGVGSAAVYELFYFMIRTLRLIHKRWGFDFEFPNIVEKIVSLRASIKKDNKERAADLLDHLQRHLEYEPFKPKIAREIKDCYREAKTSILAISVYEPNWWYMPQSSFYLGNHMIFSLKHYLREIAKGKGKPGFPNWVNPFPFPEITNYLKNGKLSSRDFLTARLFVYPDVILQKFNKDPMKQEIDFFLALHNFSQIAYRISKRDYIESRIAKQNVRDCLESALKKIQEIGSSKYQEIYRRLRSRRLQDFVLIDKNIVINLYEKNGKDVPDIYRSSNTNEKLVVDYFVVLLLNLFEEESNNPSPYSFEYPDLSSDYTTNEILTYFKKNFDS